MTTSRITHATPAAAYAHSSNRDLEAEVKDGWVPIVEPEKCMDLAKQLVRENSHINVSFNACQYFAEDEAKKAYCCPIY